MKKILCLTDFSESAQNGVLYANELAKKFSSSLILMHTYDLCDDLQKKEFHHPLQIAYTETQSRDMLYKICMDFTRANHYSNVDYGFITREGDIQKNINDIITERKIDLLVLSLEGALSPTDNYYGSVISRLIQNIKCPMLVVPKNYKYNGIQNIVYAFDMEHENSFEKKAIEFAKELNAHLDILNYCNDEDEQHAEELYAKYNDLKIQSGYNKISLDIKATENMIHSLEKFVTDRNADLLILEHHKRNLYKELTESSVTKNFVFFSKVPMLIIQSKEK